MGLDYKGLISIHGVFKLSELVTAGQGRRVAGEADQRGLAHHHARHHHRHPPGHAHGLDTGEAFATKYTYLYYSVSHVILLQEQGCCFFVLRLLVSPKASM